MPRPSDILVITTAEPANKKIKNHIKPITSHVVAGTNLISDVFASWSDIFGGRSKTYQKQLTSLYNEAVERLQYQAYHLGADCIVGLKIDIDEISGGGKSMLMITAIGTAANLEREGNQELNGKEIFGGGVSLSKIEEFKTKKKIINDAHKDELRLNDERWEYIISNRIAEVYPYLMKTFDEYFDSAGSYPGEQIQRFKKNLKIYLTSLEREDQVNLIYQTLTQEEVGDLTQELLFQIIKQENLLNFEKLWLLLKSNNIKIKKRGLALLKFDKPYYDNNDLKEYQKILDFIKENFKKLGLMTTKKQMLTGKEIEVWQCSCGNKNHLELSYCSKCYHDIFGFLEQDFKPSQAMNLINQKIEILEDLLERQSPSKIK